MNDVNGDGYVDERNYADERFVPVNDLELSAFALLPDWKKVDHVLKHFTKDMRLGNLTSSDYDFCTLYYEFASDVASEGYLDAFSVAMSRPIGVLEISQSRGGFKSKLLNTLITQHYRSEEGVKKKSFMGGSKNKNQGGYV